MKIVALEEHFVTPALTAAWAGLPAVWADDSQTLNTADIDERIGELGERRLGDMAETGVDVQVLSPTAPGVQSLTAEVAVPLARDLNDLTAATIARWPDRFGGFAALATPDPQAAVRELERAVGTLGLQGGFLYGRTRDRPLDHPDLLPVFEAAASLGVPLYLHPQTPSHGVREAYYTGLGDKLDKVFAGSGIGWHYETGLQLVRLILAGVFDRFPDLQIIVGHWGEAVLFYLERIETMAKATTLERPIADYFRSNVSVTPSGMFSHRYLRWAIEVLGVERIMFSADYPYQFAPDGGARAFLEQAELSPADRELIASGNWERLCRRRTRGSNIGS